MRMVLTAPMIITSRLMAGVKIGDAVLSVEAVAQEGHRVRFAYFVDQDGRTVIQGEDVSVAPMAGEEMGDLARKAASAVLAFLSADAETYSRLMGHGNPEDGYLFGPAGAEWAYMMDSEISCALSDLDGEG